MTMKGVYSCNEIRAEVNPSQWEYICKLKRQNRFIELNCYIEDLADLQAFGLRQVLRRQQIIEHFKSDREKKRDRKKAIQELAKVAKQKEYEEKKSTRLFLKKWDKLA